MMKSNLQKNLENQSKKSKQLATRISKRTEERLKKLSRDMDTWAKNEAKKAKKWY
ncbi:MAG: hypothetical protein U9R21_02260 [Candidatus Thermoplasmatota archaeon]|nr:hypothetical protein [Candidatus Thermoplasmatota archaeon]